MKDHDDEFREAITRFRIGVFANPVARHVGAPGIGERLEKMPERAHAIPGSDRTRIAANALRRWIKLYRDGGFGALYPTTNFRPAKLFCRKSCETLRSDVHIVRTL